MADRGGAADGWAGRCYAHLALPVPVLGEVERDLLDRAVCARDGWQPVEARLDPPVLVRRWRRGGTDLLVLVVLGWYPLLVTVGAHRAGARGRRALSRVTDAVRSAGGVPVADAELAHWVATTRDRWALVAAAHRRIDEHLPHVEFRACACCQTFTARDVPHCRGCGHRFTSQEDLARDARARAAQEVVSAAAAELAALGRGDGLFGPAAARPAGRVVA